MILETSLDPISIKDGQGCCENVRDFRMSTLDIWQKCCIKRLLSRRQDSMYSRHGAVYPRGIDFD